MTAIHADETARAVERLLADRALANWTDCRLLDSFVCSRDMTAFEVLLSRHGPMVLRVCIGILHNAHDAEDAFQATFLVLACKAGRVRNQSSLASFLHGTACRVALREKAREVRRRTVERETARMRTEILPSEADAMTMEAVLHEELARLPDRYRQVLVLCHLEGRTHEQAAHALGCPPGSVSRYLRRAAELLRDRLAGRGMAAPAAGAFVAAVPAALARAALQAVGNHLAGTTLVGGASVPAIVLANEVLQSMNACKLGGLAALVLLIGLAGAATQFAASSPDTQEKAPPALLPAPPRVKEELPALPVGAVARLGSIRFRHTGEVSALAFSPDGKAVAAAGDGHVTLSDTATGRRTGRIDAPWVRTLAFSPGGRRIVGASPEGFILWDLPSGRKVREMTAGNAQWLAWSRDGHALALMAENGTLRLRNVDQGKDLRQLDASDVKPGPDSFRMVAADPGVRTLVVQGWQGRKLMLRAWDLSTGRQRAVPKSDGFLQSLALSPDGLTLALVSGRAVHLHDLLTGKAIKTLQIDGESLTSAAFAPDGKTLATVHSRSLRLWDLAAGKESKRILEEAGIHMNDHIAFSPDGKTLASGGTHTGPVISLWDVATGNRKNDSGGAETAVGTVAFSPDGSRVAAGGGQDSTLRVWEAAGKLLSQHRVPYGTLRDCAFSPDGKLLYSAWSGNNVFIADAATGQELHRLKLNDPDRPDTTQSGLSMVLANDGKTLITTSSYGLKEPRQGPIHQELVTGWNTVTRKQVFRRTLPGSGFWKVVSPDGKWIVIPHESTGLEGARGKGSPGAGPMRLHNLSTGKECFAFPEVEGQTSPLAFQSDGRLLASTTYRDGRNILRLWETATAQAVLELPGIPLNVRVAFSPSGRILAVSTEKHEVLLWDLARGQPLHRFVGHDSAVASLAFSPDGGRLVSGLGDSTLLVWDVAAILRQRRPAAPLSAEAAARAWMDLAVEDGRRAFAALGALADDPARSVPLLAGRLRPVPSVEPDRVRQLLADLTSERFAVREKARRELEALEEQAAPAFRRSLAANPSLEMRRRVERLLDRLQLPVTRPELIQSLRAVAVLEHVGSPEARHILEGLAKGDPEARLTREARQAREKGKRLRQKPVP